MTEEDVQNICLDGLVSELLRNEKSGNYRVFKEKLTRLIADGILNPDLNWKIDDQEKLAKLIFENEELVEDVRKAIGDALAEYQRLNDLYLEFEKRYQDYRKKD